MFLGSLATLGCGALIPGLLLLAHTTRGTTPVFLTCTPRIFWPFLHGAGRRCNMEGWTSGGGRHMLWFLWLLEASPVLPCATVRASCKYGRLASIRSGRVFKDVSSKQCLGFFLMHFVMVADILVNELSWASLNT